MVPKAPEMKAAWDQFLAGNNRAARKLARSVLAGGTASPDAQAEATDLLRRIGYDPGAALSVGSAMLVVVIIVILLTVAHKFD